MERNCGLVIGALLLALSPLCTETASAQEYRVVIVHSAPAEGELAISRGFLLAASEAEDVDVRIRCFTMPDPPDRKTEQKIIDGLFDFDPQLILTTGVGAAVLLRDVVFEIPVLVTEILNPLEIGIGQGFESTGTNHTGFVRLASPELQVKILKEMLGGELKALGVIYNPRNIGQIVSRLRKACKAEGVELKATVASSREESSGAFADMQDGIDAFWMFGDSTVYSGAVLGELLRACIARKIPVVGYPRMLVPAGATLGFFPDNTKVGREAWLLANRVLTGELKQDDFRLYNPPDATVRIAYNPEAAKRIEVDIPDSVEARGEPAVVFGQ